MFNLRRPLGCSWDQIWPIGALRGPWGPPKGPFRTKSSPFKAPWGPEGARYQVKVCFDHESNSGRPMGGSWDQIWSTEVPKRTLYGQNGPFLPLFDRFLKLGGSIWTITVLDEQSIPRRFSGHPTSLYFEKKIPPQNWPVEI